MSSLRSGRHGVHMFTGGTAAARLAMDHSVTALLRHFTRDTPGAFLHEDDDLLMAASRTEYLGPMHNAAFCKRTPSPADARDVIRRADAFFDALGRRYVLWIGDHRHGALEAAAREYGFRALGSPRGAAAMALAPGTPTRRTDRPTTGPTGGGPVVVSPVTDAEDRRRFVDLVGRAFEARDRPQPRSATEALFTAGHVLAGPDVLAFLATVDGRPAAAAMVHISAATANICWVSTVPAARGHGLAALVTRACVDAGFRAGANLAVLQSSAMGAGVYHRMGFTEITRYRRLCQS